MPNDVITRAIDALASGQDLPREQAGAVLGEIMRGDASETQIAAFLIALRTKGETVDERAGLAGTRRALPTPAPGARRDLVDTAGTGGGKPTFNVSTTAALIAAGAGCALAKHGNRSATGLSGSADVLEALGARIDLKPDAVARCIDEAGFGFMFAPAHHQATRYVVPVRKELAVRTIFNFLGPLTNPAGARRHAGGQRRHHASDRGRRARTVARPRRPQRGRGHLRGRARRLDRRRRAGRPGGDRRRGRAAHARRLRRPQPGARRA